MGNSRLRDGDQWYRRERSEAVAYGEGKQADKILGSAVGGVLGWVGGLEVGREASGSATV